MEGSCLEMKQSNSTPLLSHGFQDQGGRRVIKARVMKMAMLSSVRGVNLSAYGALHLQVLLAPRIRTIDVEYGHRQTQLA